MQFYHLESSAMNTEILMSGSAVKNHSLPRLGKNIKCKSDNFVPLVVPGVSSSSGTSSSSTSIPQDSPSTSSSPVTERRDEPAPKNWRETDPFSTNENKKRNGNRDLDDRLREIFLNGWRNSQTIWTTQKCMHPHTSLRTQIRNAPRKWHQNQGSMVFTLTSQKTEIVKNVCEPKLQGFLAEDALAKQYL